MKVIIVTFCLVGAAMANPILHTLLVSSESASNSTESLSALESAENNTSELQSSEENTSNQSSESESEESTSEDKTSEESNSLSAEDDEMDSAADTKDNSMGSEENVRKQDWVRVFASVITAQSTEDNGSAEVKGEPEHQSTELTRGSTNVKMVPGSVNLPLQDNNSDTTSESADTSESDEDASSESQESKETSDSTEDSTSSESSELEQVTGKDCVNATQSCESEEQLLHSIGDDAHYPVEHLMVPDEDERELRLRR